MHGKAESFQVAVFYLEASTTQPDAAWSTRSRKTKLPDVLSGLRVEVTGYLDGFG